MWILWLLSFFVGYLVVSDSVSPENQHAPVLNSELSVRAQMTVMYINLINDWRYENPATSDGEVADSLLAWSTVKGLQNVIYLGRVFVYQENQPGLMAALMVKSRDSALIGQVVSRRLLDSTGTDMKLTVPDSIPEGYLVYVN